MYASIVLDPILLYDACVSQIISSRDEIFAFAERPKRSIVLRKDEPRNEINNSRLCLTRLS